MLAEESVGEAELSLVVIIPAAVAREELVPAGGLRPPGAPVAAPEHVADVSEEPAKHLSRVRLSIKFPGLRSVLPKVLNLFTS